MTVNLDKDNYSAWVSTLGEISWFCPHSMEGHIVICLPPITVNWTQFIDLYATI